MNLDLKQLDADGRIMIHPNHDVAVVQVGTTSPDERTFFPISGVSSIQQGDFIPIPESTVVLFTDVPNGNEVLIFGYPVELLFSQQALNKTNIDMDSPLIRRGVISQKSRTSGKFIIDSGVYGGNSGGPIILVRPPPRNVFDDTGTKYFVIGIITEYVPYIAQARIPTGNIPFTIHSGYGVAEPIDYALELMRHF